MITVEQTFELIEVGCTPLPSECIPIAKAEGCVLTRPATAQRAQPPFNASAMDGYAVRRADAAIGQTLRIIGESAAGHAFDQPLGPNEAVRIFTGGVVPDGADMVLIQENTSRDGNTLTVTDQNHEDFIRPIGCDFPADFELGQGRTLSGADIMLLAAMNVPYVHVRKQPIVAILSTGDELVPVGATPNTDQIIASNHYGIASIAQAFGAKTRIYPLIPDHPALLAQALEITQDADIIVFSGGASVGDHDLVAPALAAHGASLSFNKIAMRPGKPLMFGTKGAQIFFGLPGNPVSAFVCARLFLSTAINLLQSRRPARPEFKSAPIRSALPKGGKREHYMRGTLHPDGTLEPHLSQDSSLISVLAASNVLIKQPIEAPAANSGELYEYLTLFPNQS